MGTVLVTGATGSYGPNIACGLIDSGENVVLAYRREYHPPRILAEFMGNKAKAARCDVTLLPEISRVLRDYGVDSIVHAVDIVQSATSIPTIYEALQTKVGGTINIMEAASLAGVKKVTFLSSEAIRIGSPPDFKMGFEQEWVHIVSGNNSHPACKKCGEIITRLYAEEYGISVRIVRPGHSWGPYVQEVKRGDLGNLRDIVEGAAFKRPVNLPDVTRETHVRARYIVDSGRVIALIHMTFNPKYLVYSIAEQRPYTWGEIADTVKELEPTSKVTFASSATEYKLSLSGREQRDSADEEVIQGMRIFTELDFKPKYDLKKGLREYIDWYKDGKP